MKAFANFVFYVTYTRSLCGFLEVISLQKRVVFSICSGDLHIYNPDRAPLLDMQSQSLSHIFETMQRPNINPCIAAHTTPQHTIPPPSAPLPFLHLLIPPSHQPQAQQHPNRPNTLISMTSGAGFLESLVGLPSSCITC